MHRISLVSLIAAGIVIGHVAPHWLVSRVHRPAPPPTRRSEIAEIADIADIAHIADVAAPATPTSLATEAPPPLVAPACRLQAPLTEADREPMLAALRRLIAREQRRYPYLADDGRRFLRRFEACGVDVRERSDYVVVASAFGGEWLGARFRKTNRGWIALQLDGGDIR
jgi:hypothetical protein